MKRTAILLTLFLTALLLCACTAPPEPTEAVSAPPRVHATLPPPPVPETAPATEPPETIHTGPESLDVPVEEVILYFNEVCLDAEYSFSGDASLLQKWGAPILYRVHGTPTEEDLMTLESFVSWLNTVEGFPGIAEAGEHEGANLNIHFCSQPVLGELMGEELQYMDGAVTFWYDEDVIYDAIICIRNDLDQTLRNSVILEEIYNGLGPIQDTMLRPDSIIFSEFSQPQNLTPMDELILKLLYHPDMKCGMDAAECEAVIRRLYQ